MMLHTVRMENGYGQITFGTEGFILHAFRPADRVQVLPGKQRGRGDLNIRVPFRVIGGVCA